MGTTTNLQLSKIEVKREYLQEWNENLEDFVVLEKDGVILRNTLYRKGGLNFNLKVGIDKYFMLLKYTEEVYDLGFIKECYPNKTKKEQGLSRKHLKSQWVIIDFNGDEKVVFDQFTHGYLVDSSSIIYSIGDKYYNVETGYFYCSSYTSMKSSEFLFLDNKYDDDKTKKGIMKVDLKNGDWEIFK